MADPVRSPVAQQVVDAATLAYGPRWQLPLSASSGITQTMLSRIDRGLREVDSVLARPIADALVKESKSMKARAADVKKLADLIRPKKET